MRVSADHPLHGADCHLGTPEAALVPPIYPIADPLSLVLTIPKPLKLHPLYHESFPLDAANFLFESSADGFFLERKDRWPVEVLCRAKDS